MSVVPTLALLALLAQVQPSRSSPARGDTVRLSFPEAMERARKTNPSFVQQQLQAQNADIDLARERARRYLPDVDLDFTVPEYIDQIQGTPQNNGTILYKPTFSRRLQTDLVVTQPLLTGGTLRVAAGMSTLDQPLLLDTFPKLRFTGKTALSVQLSQQFFGINQSIRAYRLAREAHARAQAQFADQERNLARNVINAYFGLVQARKQAEVDSVIFIRDSTRYAGLLRRRTAPSGTAELDSLKFEYELSRSALNRTRSRQNLNRVQLQMNEMLGLSTGALVVPDTAVAIQRFVPDVARGVVSANANRQDLQLARLSVENRRAGLRDARRTSPITLAVNSSLGYNGISQRPVVRRSLHDALSDQVPATRINLLVSIPLFDRFEEKHAVARAKNDLEAAETNLADQQRRIENEVRLAAERVVNASAVLDLAETSLRLTRRTLEIQAERFERGDISSAELLLDQASARQAEISIVQAQIDYLTATEEWRRAIGERTR